MKNQKSSMYLYVCAAIIILGIIGTFLYGFTVLLIALFGVMIIIMLFRNPMDRRSRP